MVRPSLLARPGAVLWPPVDYRIRTGSLPAQRMSLARFSAFSRDRTRSRAFRWPFCDVSSPGRRIEIDVAEMDVSRETGSTVILDNQEVNRDHAVIRFHPEENSCAIKVVGREISHGLQGADGMGKLSWRLDQRNGAWCLKVP